MYRATCEGRALQSKADQQLPQLVISLHLHKLDCLHVKNDNSGVRGGGGGRGGAGGNWGATGQ